MSAFLFILLIGGGITYLFSKKERAFHPVDVVLISFGAGMTVLLLLYRILFY